MTVVAATAPKCCRRKLKCLYIDESFALVQWPPESYVALGKRKLVSGCVMRYSVADLKRKQEQPELHLTGFVVWFNARDRDGPLTKKRLSVLIDEEKRRAESSDTNAP